MLLTELQVREDSMTLFAFGSAGERESFRALTSVQGVGGRVALAILSVLDPAELARAVAQGDKAMISRASGVGPKLATRIANELAGKLGSPGARRRGRIARPARRPRPGRPQRASQPRLQTRRSQRRRRRGERRVGGWRDVRRAGAVGAEEGGEMRLPLSRG